MHGFGVSHGELFIQVCVCVCVCVDMYIYKCVDVVTKCTYVDMDEPTQAHHSDGTVPH